jgi:hypothetical protein
VHFNASCVRGMPPLTRPSREVSDKLLRFRSDAFSGRFDANHA